MEYRFLTETNKIENASFSYKTALSEANVKTNRMATTKWTYHKEWSFARNFFFFFFFKFVSVLESFKKSSFGVPMVQMSIFVFFASAGV